MNFRDFRTWPLSLLYEAINLKAKQRHKLEAELSGLHGAAKEDARRTIAKLTDDINQLHAEIRRKKGLT